MSKMNKKLRRLLRFAVMTVVIMTVVLNNIVYVAYSWQYSQNVRNDFIGTDVTQPKQQEYANLTITKTVRNADGSGLTSKETTDQFVFIVNFSDDGTYTVSIGGVSQNIQSGGIIVLKHGQSAVISNLPVGTTYSVEETAYPGEYTVSGSNHQGTIGRGGIQVAFINTAPVTVIETTTVPPPTTTQPTTPSPSTTQPPTTTQAQTTTTERQETIIPSTDPPTQTPQPTLGTDDYSTPTEEPLHLSNNDYNNQQPSENVVPSIYNETDETDDPLYVLDDNNSPGGNMNLYDDLILGSLGETDAPLYVLGDNNSPGENMSLYDSSLKNPPKTNDEETDPRIWLGILAISAFILRYILFGKKRKSALNSEAEN